MTSWIRSKTGGNPSNIKNGYTLGGSQLESYGDVIFIAPFGVAAMGGSSSQAWVDALWNKIKSTTEGTGDYYASAIKLQSMLIMSGNGWAP